jgi:hypothetical protein
MFKDSNLTSLPDGVTLDNLRNGGEMFRRNNLTSLPDGMTLPNLDSSGNAMFAGNTINTERYSQLLIDMEAGNSNLNVEFHGGSSKYNAAGGVARNLLSTNQNWSFTDGGSAIDSDYQNVLNFATSEGDTLPSLAQQELQNQVVLSLKNKGLWSKKDAFGLFATNGNVDFALICWKRLIKMTAFNSPSFSANAGFTGNGSSSYISTNFIPATDGVNFLQDDAGISVNCSGADNNYIVGNSSTSNGNQRIRIGDDKDSMINGSVFISGINLSAGNLHLDRISSTQVVCQENTNIGSIISNNSTSLQNNEIWLLRISTIEANANIKAFSARASFTETEKNDYNLIINTYLNAL